MYLIKLTTTSSTAKILSLTKLTFLKLKNKINKNENLREESTLVAPAAETPSHSIWCSNIDLVISSFHMSTVYFYRPSGEADFFDVAALKAALSRVLVHFYPMAGRLRTDGDGRLEIDCNAKGVLFVVAECDAVLDDLGDFASTMEFRRLVPAVDYSQGVSEYPLFVIQVTRFNCGEVCLGVANQHNLVDGYSALHFINSWSRAACGLDIAPPLPFFDRTLLAARSLPRPQFKHIEYDPLATVSRQTETVVSMFKLTRDHLDTLKSKCNRSGGGDETAPRRTSFWRPTSAAACARLVSYRRGIYMAVDARSRLRPPLPQGYFGNAIFAAVHVGVSGDLLSRATREIHDALARMDDEYLRSTIDFLELQGDLKALIRGPHTYGNPNLGITSWARLQVYKADFGWGKPFFMGPATIPFEGLCYVLGSPVDDGGVTIAIRLEMEPMELFGKLLYQI